MKDSDINYLEMTFELARNAREKGNHPFGALLVSPDGEVLLRAENTVVSDKDSTAHAETNLVRKASHIYSDDFLQGCTLYTSTEPCPMCSGAIFWGNIGRVVFGLSEDRFYRECIPESSKDVLLLSSRVVFSHGRKEIEVIGPLSEEEAKTVHDGFW